MTNIIGKVIISGKAVKYKYTSKHHSPPIQNSTPPNKNTAKLRIHQTNIMNVYGITFHNWYKGIDGNQRGNKIRFNTHFTGAHMKKSIGKKFHSRSTEG